MANMIHRYDKGMDVKFCMKGILHFIATAMYACLIADVYCAETSMYSVQSYIPDTNPTQQNWTLLNINAGDASSVVGPIVDSTYLNSAWGMTVGAGGDISGGHIYHYDLGQRDQALLSQHGWQYSAEFRLFSTNLFAMGKPIGLRFANNDRSYDLLVGRSGESNINILAVTTYPFSPSLPPPSPQGHSYSHICAANEYHTYTIAFDSAQGSATVSIDSNEVITGYYGASGTPRTNRLSWELVSDHDAGNAVAYWRHLSLSATIPDSPPTLGPRINAETTVFSWYAHSNITYHVQGASDIVAGDWQDMAQPVNGSNQELTTIITNNGAYFFYRLSSHIED